MSYSGLYAAILIGVADWVAVGRRWRVLEYLAKPGVMLALLAWLWLAGGFSGPMIWFAIGLVCSLAGDIFLMLPRERFLAGLVAFLLAHLAYLAGFNPTPPPVNAASLVLAVMVGLTAIRLYRAIATGLTISGNGRLRIPVLAYSIVISLMLLAALLTLARSEWDPLSAIMASTGALLFFVSDSILAWNKFVQPLRFGRLASIITYHLGQVLIISGAAGHFLSLG